MFCKLNIKEEEIIESWTKFKIRNKQALVVDDIHAKDRKDTSIERLKDSENLTQLMGTSEGHLTKWPAFYVIKPVSVVRSIHIKVYSLAMKE